MRSNELTLPAVLACVLLAAVGCQCGGSPTGENDGGFPDAGSHVQNDAGRTEGQDGGNDEDAGHTEQDAGHPPPMDAGQPTTDGGTWVWSSPLPQGETLRAVYAAANDLAWAVGEHGTVLRWDGSAWTLLPFPEREDLYSVWGSSEDNLWIGGDDASVFQWDGAQWTEHKPKTGLFDEVVEIVGTGPDDVWFRYISAPFVAHWNGAAWAVSDTGNMHDTSGIASAGPGAVYVSTTSSGLFHFDGTTWTPLYTGGSLGGGFEDVVAFSPTDVWGYLGQRDPCFYRFDGTSTVPVSCTGFGPLREISAASPTEIWSVNGAPLGVFDGSAWTSIPTGLNRSLLQVHARANGEVWAVGEYGAIVGGSLSAGVSTFSSGPVEDFGGIWLASATDGWAGRASAVQGASELWHFDGTAWTRTSLPITFGTQALWGTSGSDVWAVGSPNVSLHYDGAAWSSVSTGIDEFLFDVMGTGPNDVWAVGYYGSIAHWNGSVWEEVPSGNNEYLYSVWALNPASAFIAGTNGTVLSWNGQVWTPLEKPNNQHLRGIWAANASAVYVVGTNGTFRKWNGSAWIGLDGVPTSVNLNAIWGRSEDALYLAGDDGALFLFNGHEAVAIDNPASFDLEDLHGLETGEVFVSGEFGTILWNQGGPHE